MTQAPPEPKSDKVSQVAAEEQEKLSLAPNEQSKSRWVILIVPLLAVVTVAAVIAAARLIHYKHEDAFYLVGLFVVIGLLLAKILQKTTAVEAGWPIMAVIALPAVLYLVFAGYVTGLKVPGGLEIELQAILKEPPQFTFQPAAILDLKLSGVPTEDFDPSGKCITGNFNSVLAQQQKDISQLVSLLPAQLACNGKIHFVVFIDSEQKFIGMVEADRVLDTFADTGETSDVKTALDQADSTLLLNTLNTLYGPSEVVSLSVADDTSAGELLQLMTIENINAIAVTRADGEVSAIVERDVLTSQILMKVAGIDEPPLPKPTAEPTPALIETLTPPLENLFAPPDDATPASQPPVVTDAGTPQALR